MGSPHRTLAAVLVPALLVALAACSGDGDPQREPEPGGTGSPSPGDPDQTGSEPSWGWTPAPPTTGPVDPPETSPPPDDPEDPESPPLQVVIGAAGDILPHNRVVENAATNAGGDGYDFRPMFADVAELIGEPDLSLCHLETPLSPDNTDLAVPGTLVFNSPREVATALADAGFDGCDFASNHTLDRGMPGLAATEQVLEEEGLGYAGPRADEDVSGEPTWYTAADARIAHFAYTYTYPNDASPNTHVPGDWPWLEDNLWPLRGAEGIIEDAELAKADGADFVVVSMHWGAEYIIQPTTDQREIATELLESGTVDLILGTHAHVIQPCERINDRYVLYGLGNFLSNQSPDTTNGALLPETQEGLVAQVTLNRDPDGQVTSSLTAQPTRVQIDNHVIRLATPEQHATTYERTMDTLRSLDEGSCDVEPWS